MHWFFWMLIALAVILVLILPLICYMIVFFSPYPGQNNIYDIPKGENYQRHIDRMIKGIRTLSEVKGEDIFIQGTRKARLHGSLFLSTPDAPVAICFHGYRATAVRDFSGGALFLMEQGYNVLMIDERATGRSSTHTITFGVNERMDCLKWIEYVNERFGKDHDVLLYGISMGAATILMASGLELPENIKGIVADSPYTSPKEIIQAVIRNLKIPPSLLYPFIRMGAWMYGHFDLEQASSLEAVQRTKTPILIIHGEADGFVPCEMGVTLGKSNPSMIEYHTFPGADHGISYMEDTERYLGYINDFTGRCLNR